MDKTSCNGHPVDLGAAYFGELKASNDILDDVKALQQRAEDDGYIFVRGLIDPNTVLQARREILLKYATVGEIDNIHNDAMDGVLRDSSYITQINLDAFVTSLRTGAHYESVVLHPELLGLFKRILGGAVQPFDFRWPRMMRVGEGCGIHADIPYIGRGTRKVWTSWIPLGDIPHHNGPLIILEGSHKNPLLDGYFSKDAAKEKLGWLERDPVALQKKLGGRWLSTHFLPGDVLCFSGHVVHGALDNNSPQKRCRLSSDTRYQLKDDIKDSRWFGNVANPYGGDYENGRRVFYPGLIASPNGNADLKEEWKPVDEDGRLVLN